jgi:hypothetical protein
MRWIYHLGAAVGVLTSLCGLYFGLVGSGPGPRWLWIVIAYAAVAFAGSMMWLEEHKKAKERLEKAVVLHTLDDRCIALMESAAAIRKTYPQIKVPIKSKAWLPEPTKEQGDKAALHRFNGRLDDFLVVSQTFTDALKVKLPTVEDGDLESVEKQLTDIHNRLLLLLAP